MKATKIEIGRWYTATEVSHGGTRGINLMLRYYDKLPFEVCCNLEWHEHYVSPLNEAGIAMIHVMMIGYTCKDETKYFINNYRTALPVKEWGTQRMGMLD